MSAERYGAVVIGGGPAGEVAVRVATSRVALADVIARQWTYEQNCGGELGLICDRERQVLIGAWAVAPLAGEWIHYAALAIKTQTPLSDCATPSRSSPRSPRPT